MAGLAAAHELVAGGADVVVLEGSNRLGGKLLLGEVGGLTLDLGAESILARRPEGLDLMHAVGLDDRTVNPRTTDAAIWTRGALRPLPPTVMVRTMSPYFSPKRAIAPAAMASFWPM